jgi:hypothetical protein
MSTQPPFTAPTTSSALTPGYTCSFCRRTFSPTNPPVIGERPEDRIGRLSGMLAGHLAKEHKQEFATLALSGQQVVGWILTTQFRHNDPQLTQFSEATRKQIRKITKVVEISDEKIAAQVDALLSVGNGATRENLIRLLKGMRDAIEETPPTPA